MKFQFNKMVKCRKLSRPEYWIMQLSCESRTNMYFHFYSNFSDNFLFPKLLCLIFLHHINFPKFISHKTKISSHMGSTVPVEESSNGLISSILIGYSLIYPNFLKALFFNIFPSVIHCFANTKLLSMNSFQNVTQ